MGVRFRFGVRDGVRIGDRACLGFRVRFRVEAMVVDWVKVGASPNPNPKPNPLVHKIQDLL